MKSVRGKLLIVFMLITGLFVTFAIYSSWNTYQANQQIDEIRTNQLPILLAKEQMTYNIADRLALSRGYLLFNDETYRNEFKEVSEVNKQLEERILQSTQEESFIEAINQAQEWEDVLTFQVFGLMADGEFELAARNMNERSTPIAEEMVKTFQTLAEEERASIDQSMESIVAFGERLQWITLILACMMILLFTWLFLKVSNMISTPLRRLAAVANLIAGGDLRGNELATTSSDEISVVTSAFNQMREALKKVIGTTTTLGKTVTLAANKLSDSSNDSEQSAHTVTSYLQTLAAMSEMSAVLTTQSLERARGIKETVVTIDQATTSATDTSHQMDQQAKAGQTQIVEAMNQSAKIEQTVFQAANVMERLHQNTWKINQMVAVLTEVSEQTQLLALNASIEAARAGSHGQGFAVVASEVQKLSIKSKKAASQISEMVHTIQDETNQAVREIKTGRAEVIEGTARMNQVFQSFKQISASVQKVYTEMEGVSDSTRSISSNIRDLHIHIQEVSDASREHVRRTGDATKQTEEQLASTQKIKNLASDLAEKTKGLEEELSIFKLP
ncbi:methyl-accepting chemotaxis protein [Alkalicoccobacillus gibsonii]|uniref:Methyl-accepting chemotaxis protein n=1 Tax=Alkalicoccobacillus gibsonii TaxID=79881 RepID=A0ABU9VME7_9BACI